MFCSHYPISRFLIAHVCYASGGPDRRVAGSSDKPVLWMPLLSTACPKHKGLQAASFLELYVIKTLQDALLKYPRVLESRTCVFEGWPSSGDLLSPVLLPKRVFAASSAKTGTRPIGLKI